MSNYETLVNILDQIRKEAPSQYKTYYPLESEMEKLNQARSRAFVHLYLKVKFGLLDFIEREGYVVDGTDDGGIDGYYIDKENKLGFLEFAFWLLSHSYKYKHLAQSHRYFHTFLQGCGSLVCTLQCPAFQPLRSLNSIHLPDTESVFHSLCNLQYC